MTERRRMAGNIEEVTVAPLRARKEVWLVKRRRSVAVVVDDE